MSYTEPLGPRRAVPALVAACGFLVFLGSLALEPEAMVAGAVVLLLACVLAVRETAAPVVTWSNSIVCLVLIIWLIPIKTYRLPIELPFALEPYRIFLLALVGVWFLAALAGRATLGAGGHGRALALFAGAALVSQIVNFQEIDAGPLEGEALKALSYFFSFVVIFLVVTSTVSTFEGLERVVRAMVVGAIIVAVGALYDSRFSYNVFDHLSEFFPGLVQVPREVVEERGGRLRVYGSAQHPIALGCALLMVLPLAIYLAGRATTLVRSRLWLVGAVVIAAGALATVSRTTVVMLVGMTLMAIWLRGRTITRFWPLLIVLPFGVHFVAPGALGGLYKSFFPKHGLVTDLTERAGQGGSGRFADVGPGLELWTQSPVVGHGLGSQTVAAADPGEVSPGQAVPELIFDNQYLNTLVTLGVLGIVAALWMVWGSAAKLGRAARQRAGPVSDLLVASAVASVGFGASMVLFDAFYFVQATLVFFVVAAVGFRARALAQDPIRA